MKIIKHPIIPHDANKSNYVIDADSLIQYLEEHIKSLKKNVRDLEYEGAMAAAYDKGIQKLYIEYGAKINVYEKLLKELKDA